MPPRSARALLLLLASPLPACLPLPHFDRSAPAFDGVLLAEGRPAAGVTVRLAVNPSREERGCPAGSAEATTDAGGHFSFPAPGSYSPVVVFGDREDTWRLCVLGAGGGVWEESGMWGGPTAERFLCELGAPGDVSRATLPLPAISGALAQRGCWVRRLAHPFPPAAP